MAKTVTIPLTKPTAKRAAKPAAASAPEPTDALTIDTIPEGIHVEFEPFMALIPLSRLRLTELNVRQTERDADVASLAEDIAQRGLKQNLIVSPAHWSTMVAEDGETSSANLFEVTGGGRRTQALKLLAAAGRLPADHPVQCRVEPRGEARESSLSENLHRVAMNPADEFTAFDQIAAEQRDRHHASQADAVAYVAKRFGVTVKHVEGRLRLAALAPEILEALRKGAISLDSAKAYAGSTDHELQVKVFLDQCKPGAWRPHHPDQVRQELRGITLSLDDPQMKFIGIEAYRAAGGRTETEMFMRTEGEERALDVKLVQQLAAAKAEPMVGPLAQEQGFDAGLLANGVGHSARLPKAPAGTEQHMSWKGEPSKAILARSIAVYAIGHGGDGLIRVGMFVPKEEKPTATVAPSRDWRAEQRKEMIFNRAAQNVARRELANYVSADEWPDVVWPDAGDWGGEAEQDGDNETQFLAPVFIRVPLAAIEAELVDAEREHDAVEAAKKAAAEAAAAQADDEPEAEREDEDAEA